MAASLTSIILPVYNQADHIREIAIDHIRALEKVNFEYELLLVVNNSRDESFIVCQSLAAENKMIRTLNIEAGGWGLAVKAGL